MNKDDVIKAVQALKNSEYGANAIKVELEAQFNREGDDYIHCADCDGNGRYCNSEECDQDYDCDHYCDTCSGDGEYYIESSGWDEDECQAYMIRELEKLGLAEHGEIKRPLTWAQFYNDGSVDSEFTFTLLLDNPENVFVLPKIIDIWNSLGNEIGNGVHVNGAGMHMAILKNKDGVYRRTADYSNETQVRFVNFKKAMTLMMPALYCLGAEAGRSRGLNYREPRVGGNTHRSAIDLRGNAIEFRIFDTCYDNPDQILDNVVVISNAMKYWTLKYNDPKLDKITKKCNFGIEGGYELNRLYTTHTHIDLLNAGLKRLKPAYYTIGEIKKARGLSIDKRKLGSKYRRFERGLPVEYKEYVERFEWRLEATKYRLTADLLDGEARKDAKDRKDRKELEKTVNNHIKEEKSKLRKFESYVRERRDEFNKQQGGNYELCVA